MFIIYVLLLFIISNGIGKTVLRKLEKIKFLSVPIGFVIFMGVLQLGYYPMQFFQVSSKCIHIYTAILSLFFFAYGIIKTKKDDFYFLKRYEFYILIILIFGVIKILPATDAGDDSFYMPLIIQNAETEKINSINPRSGWSWNVDEFYKYQGYYLFESSLYKVQNFIFNSTDDIFITFRTTMSIFIIITFSIILYGIKKINIIENKKIGFLITILSILVIGTLELSHLYWGSNLIYIVGLPCLLLLLSEYIQDPSSKTAFTISVLGFGLNAIASSSLFLQIFILICFFILGMKNKNIKIYDYLIMLLPNFIYLVFFVDKIWLFIPIILIYILLYNKKISEIFNNLFNSNIMYIIIFLIPIVMLLLGIVFKLEFSWNIYRVGYGTLLANIMIILAIIYLYIQNKKMETPEFVFLIFFLLFFNPLVAPFVSEYLTSKIVYYRLFYITKSPFMIIAIFYHIYLYIKDKKIIYTYLYIIAMCVLIMRYGYMLAKYTLLEPTYFSKYNYILREDKDSKELGEFLYKNSEKYNKNIVTSMYFSPRQYSLNYYANTYRYPYESRYLNEDKDSFTIFLYNNENITKEDMYNFKNAMHKNKTKIVITYSEKAKKMEELINFNFIKIFENSTYSVYYFDY